MSVKIGVKGLARVEVLSGGEVIRDTGFFPNLLLNNFFNQITKAASSVSIGSPGGRFCAVGTGTTPPVATEVSLVNAITGLVAGTSGGTGNSGDAYVWDSVDKVYRASLQTVFVFSAGSVVGNVSELGFTFFSKSQTLNTLESRVLVKDSEGTPTSITVTAAEQLRVTHILQNEVGGEDEAYQAVIGGVTYDVLARIGAIPGSGFSFVSAYDGFTGGTWVQFFSSAANLGAAGAGASGTAAYGSPTPVVNWISAPNVNTKRLRVSVDPGYGNPSGGIKIATFTSATGDLYKYEFTPVIPKTSEKILTLDFDLEYVRL
uniref:hypothetical protein n=1 Tax=Rheinheimera sp. TaxID=1869214 RepID=UPI0040474A3E